MASVTERLESIYGNRKWVLAAQAAVATRPMQELLSGWGAETLVVASNEGTGEVPDTTIVYTRSGGDTAVESIREFFRSVVAPAPEIQREVDRFDPAMEARVLAEPYATASEMVGRRTFGVRRQEWSAWEDKMRVDSLWSDLGIPHAPYRVVPVDDAPRAAVELASDLGTVWVADNTEGWHGGGEYVRWVPPTGGFEEAVSWYSGRAGLVRVMPFLDGLPCSIHGWVSATGVAVFEPVEILIFRHADGSGLAYSGVATLWTAPDHTRDEMRSISLAVGQALRERDDYRGPYGIDGILTLDGFRPTELNPRMSAGAGIQLAKVDVPLGLLMRAEAEGEINVDHEWLERSAREHRKPGIHFGKMVRREVRDEFHVALSGGAEVVATDDEAESAGKVIAGPSATGSYVTGQFDPDRVGVGPPSGPFVAAVLNLASQRWELGLPEMAAAPYLIG